MYYIKKWIDTIHEFNVYMQTEMKESLVFLYYRKCFFFRSLRSMSKRLEGKARVQNLLSDNDQWD